MKRSPLLSAALTFAILRCAAPGSMAAPTSLSMEVRPTTSGGAAKSSNDLHERSGPGMADYTPTRESKFSSHRKRGSGIGLDAEVRNLGRVPEAANLEWFLLARDVNGGDAYVFDKGSKVVSLQPVSREVVEIDSPELTSSTEKQLTLRSGYAQSGNQSNSASVKKSGAKVAGWIVRLTAGGKVLKVQASSPTFEAIGKEESRLRTLPNKGGK